MNIVPRILKYKSKFFGKRTFINYKLLKYYRRSSMYHNKPKPPIIKRNAKKLKKMNKK